MLRDFLTGAASRAPDAPAVIDRTGTLTYGELYEEARVLARVLRGAGVASGDRVVVLGTNSVATASAFWAVVLSGAVVVMVNSGTPSEKLAWLIDDAGASAVVVEARLADRVVAAGMDALPPVILIGPAGADAPVGIEPPGGGPRPDTGAEELPVPRPHELAALIYTSGSTGRPKAVTMTHANVDAAARSISTYLGLESSDIVLCALPLSFDYGLYQLIMGALTGACVVLERSFELPGQVLNTIARERVTVFPGVPTMFAMLERLGSPERWDLLSVRLLTSTGSALGPAHIAWLRHAFPVAQVFSMYGLTECKRCTYLPPADLDRKPGSVGIVIPGNEIWLVDEDGAPVAPGQAGELVVRGPTVMAGYWRRPEETARCLRPGPDPGELVLHTGDLCRMDEDGYLYFVSRTDDVIKSGGEKVAPAEVEAALRSLPGVLEAAVVGVEHQVMGEAVKAFVVPHVDAELTAAGLRAGCRERLEPFMVPRSFEVVDELPRTAHGKIARAALV